LNLLVELGIGTLESLELMAKVHICDYEVTPRIPWSQPVLTTNDNTPLIRQPALCGLALDTPWVTYWAIVGCLLLIIIPTLVQIRLYGIGGNYLISSGLSGS